MAVVAIYLLELLSLIPIVLMFREFFRDVAAGPDMGYIALLAYVLIGIGLTAWLIAHLANLDQWKAALAGLYAPCLQGAGGLVCFWAFIKWSSGWSLAAALGLFLGGVASFFLGVLLDASTPEQDLPG